MFTEKLNVKEQDREKSKYLSMAPVCSFKHLHPYLIFVIFFTQAKFLENKFTPKFTQ